MITAIIIILLLVLFFKFLVGMIGFTFDLFKCIIPILVALFIFSAIIAMVFN